MKIALYSDSTFIIGESEDYFLLLSKYRENNMIIDRLFRRYVRREDVLITKQELLKLPDNRYTKNLINAFDYRSKSAEYFLEDWGEYLPIRLILADEPYCTLSRNIPLEDYDNNDGEPFWMRPEYILEHYSQTCGDYKYKD